MLHDRQEYSYAIPHTGQFFLTIRQKFLALFHAACGQLNGHTIFKAKIDRRDIARQEMFFPIKLRPAPEPSAARFPAA